METRDSPILELPGTMPTAKLLAIWDASDQLLQSVLQKDRQQTLRDLVLHVRDLLNAEACALFLPADDSPNDLVLEATFTEAKGPDFHKGKRLPIASVPRGGLTGHVAKSRGFINYDRGQLASNPFSVGGYHDHLVNGEGFSYLGVPLLDQHGRLLGVITVDNKKNAQGKVDPEARFDAVDEFIARVLAKKLAVVLENVRRFDVIRGIMEDVQNIHNPSAVLHSILKRTLALLHADRGDFALYDTTSDKLIVSAVHGKASAKTLKVGQDVPDPSCMYAAWRSPDGWRMSDDVKTLGPNYYESHPEAKSEIALRFEFKGRIGVLNAESFERNAFNLQDKEVLALIASCAAVAARVAGEQSQLLALTQRVLEFSSNSHDILDHILAAVRSMFRVDRGIIYIADYEKKILRCDAVMGCEHIPNATREFFYPFHEDAAATMVLTNRTGFYCPDVDVDPQINVRGRDYFDIHGPLVGVPLIFGLNKVMGVLVVWSHQTPPPSRDLLQRLKPIATLAASKIAMWESEDKRHRTQRELEFSERLYRSLVEHLPHYILRKDANLKFTYANKHACRLLGADRDDVIGHDDFVFYPRDLALRYQEDDRRVMQTRQPIIDAQEPHYAPALKKMLTVRFSKSPIIDPNGDVVGVQTVFRDVTDQLEEERKRKTLEERWRRLVEVCPDTILLLNDGVITFVNEAGSVLLGSPREQLHGKALADFVTSPGGSLPHDMDKLIEGETGGLPQEATFVRKSDGTPVVVELSACRMSGTPNAEVLLVVHDIRKRKKMLASLDQAQKRIEILHPKKVVFVSYSHRDKARIPEMRVWLDQLHWLNIDPWVDTQIAPGRRWKDEIQHALNGADAAIVLVSNHLLTSAFISDLELPTLLQAAATRELAICPVLVSPVPEENPLRQLQFINESPLQSCDRAQRDEVWKLVYQWTRRHLGRSERD
jgi:PAS domain S-box-containing protein